MKVKVLVHGTWADNVTKGDLIASRVIRSDDGVVGDSGWCDPHGGVFTPEEVSYLDAIMAGKDTRFRRSAHVSWHGSTGSVVCRLSVDVLP